MDISLIVERTLNVGACLEVLTDKDIFDSISEDGATIEDLQVDVLVDYWLEVSIEGELAGVVQFKRKFSRCWDCHIHILKQHRKHSIEAGKLILEWCKDNLKGSTLYTNIPEFCPNVKSFLINFGFIETGTINNAWFKHGKLNNMNILTREV